MPRFQPFTGYTLLTLFEVFDHGFAIDVCTLGLSDQPQSRQGRETDAHCCREDERILKGKAGPFAAGQSSFISAMHRWRKDL